MSAIAAAAAVSARRPTTLRSRSQRCPAGSAATLTATRSAPALRPSRRPQRPTLWPRRRRSRSPRACAAPATPQHALVCKVQPVRARCNVSRRTCAGQSGVPHATCPSGHLAASATKARHLSLGLVICVAVDTLSWAGSWSCPSRHGTCASQQLRGDSASVGAERDLHMRGAPRGRAFGRRHSRSGAAAAPGAPARRAARGRISQWG